MDEPHNGPDSIRALTGDIVHAWSSQWGDGGLWEDILRLSGLFWAADTDTSKRVAWHHLVLAVGNFKRQPGYRLRPAQLDVITEPPAIDRPLTAEIPVRDGLLTVHMDKRGDWEALSSAIPGSGVPTTTTLLAGLWPHHHFVFDWRVHAAANGLRIAENQTTPNVVPDSAAPTSETFVAYEVVRNWVKNTAFEIGTDPWNVERALYQLSRRVPNADHRTWRQYGDELKRLLQSS